MRNLVLALTLSLTACSGVGGGGFGYGAYSLIRAKEVRVGNDSVAAVSEIVVTEIQGNQDRSGAVGFCAGTLKHPFVLPSAAPRTASSDYSPSSVGILTARAGTTVEIACLYTICVTVFLSSTTYWSNDSTCPCNLMPLTR